MQISGIDSSGVGRNILTESDGTVHNRSDAYNSTASLDRVGEQDPLSAHHSETTVVEIASASGVDGTYYYYVDMDGYKELGLQFILNGGSGTVTVSVEGTIQDDGTAPASCSYIDIGSTLYSAATWTADAVELDTKRIAGQCKYIRIKVVASTGGADNSDWTIYAKQVY